MTGQGLCLFSDNPPVYPGAVFCPPPEKDGSPLAGGQQALRASGRAARAACAASTRRAGPRSTGGHAFAHGPYRAGFIGESTGFERTRNAHLPFAGRTALGAGRRFIAKNQLFKLVSAGSADKVKHGHTHTPETFCDYTLLAASRPCCAVLAMPGRYLLWAVPAYINMNTLKARAP